MDPWHLKPRCGSPFPAPWTANSYAYADDDPVDRIDPTGRAALAEYGIDFRPLLIASAGVYILANALAQDSYCSGKLVACLLNPWQPDWNVEDFGRRKDCGACYRFCKHNDYWPSDKCPD